MFCPSVRGTKPTWEEPTSIAEDTPEDRLGGWRFFPFPQ
jgi:hypothetical protein